MINKIFFNKESKSAWLILEYFIEKDAYLCELINIKDENLLGWKTGRKEYHSTKHLVEYNDWVFIDNIETFKVLYGKA